MRGLAIPMLYTDRELSGVSVIASSFVTIAAARKAGLPEWWEMVVAAGPWGYGSSWHDEERSGVSLLAVGDVTEVNEDPPVSWDMLRPLLPRKGRVVYDVVLNNRYVHSATIANTLKVPPGRWYQQVEIPVVTWLSETGEDPSEHQLNGVAGRALLLANTLVGPTIVMQDRDRDWLLEALEPFGLPNEPEIHVVPPCADLGAIDLAAVRARANARRSSTGRLVVFHGGSLEGARRLGTLNEAMPDSLDLLLVSQQPFADGVYPRARKIGDVDHANYLSLLGEGDLVYIGRKYVGTGLAYLEAMAAGMLPVVFDAPWMTQRLPDGYPLQTRTPSGLAGLLERAGRDYDALWAEWMPQIQARMSVFQPEAVAHRMHEVLDRVTAPAMARNIEAAKRWSPGFDLISKAVEKERIEEVTDATPVLAAMARVSRTGNGGGWYGPLALRLMLMALGFKDRYSRSGLDMVR